MNLGNILGFLLKYKEFKAKLQQAVEAVELASTLIDSADLKKLAIQVRTVYSELP